MGLTLEQRQAALNTFRFMENERDLFPKDAKELTRAQGLRLDYLVSLVGHRNALRKTQTDLENTLASLRRGL